MSRQPFLFSCQNSFAGLRTSWSTLRRELVILVALAILAITAGFILNHFRKHPLPLVYESKAERLQQSVARLAAMHSTGELPVSDIPLTNTDPEMIDLARFHDLVEQKAVILDARPSLFYQLGHVPGAHSLSQETFGADYTRELGYFEAHRGIPVVVYCAGDACVDSQIVAAGLKKLGYARVMVFQGGWAEWQQAGLPEEHK